jgi:hypothetical protein
MAASNSNEPLDDLVPVAAAAWGAGAYSLRNGKGECARYLKVVTVTENPSLVLNLENGQQRTYTVANAGLATGWETSRGLRIASIDATTANVSNVLVGW